MIYRTVSVSGEMDCLISFNQGKDLQRRILMRGGFMRGFSRKIGLLLLTSVFDYANLERDGFNSLN